MNISIQPFIDKIKNVISTYALLKILIPLLIGALAGSGLITFINRYAIYNYAVSYGGRLPAESVPYIDVSISILSFAFLSISLLIAIIVYGFLDYVAESVHKNFTKIPDVLIPIIAGMITSVVSIGSSGIILDISKERSIDISIDWIQLLYIIAIGVVLALFIYWKSYIKYLGFLATVFLIIFVSSRLFDAENYASFLRKIQYGGGVAVTAIIDKDKKEISGHLFLTTRDTYVIWNKNLKQFEEIPIKTTKQINYHEDYEYALPSISGSIVVLFEHLWRI